MHGFLFHDYETFGLDTTSAASQFAAVRTDNLFEETERMNIFCVPPEDLVPNATACLVTGITPSIASSKGVDEYSFAKRISEAMLKKPNTYVVGYNSLSFDDEVSRNLFYRNLIDPYKWSWKDGNKRLDILPLVRLVHALHPEALKWKARNDKATSFKLEDMCIANEITQENAHDALDDVLALKGLTKLIAEKVPELFNNYLMCSNAKYVKKYMNNHQVFGLAHYSFRKTDCVSHVTKLIDLPQKKAVTYNLLEDPTYLKEMSTDDLVEFLKLRSKEREERGLPVSGFVKVKENGCPAIFSASLEQGSITAAIKDDPNCIDRNLKFFSDNPEVIDRIREAYAALEADRKPIPNDTDLNLYCSLSGGFFIDCEVRTAEHFHNASCWHERAAILEREGVNTRIGNMMLRVIGRANPDALPTHLRPLWNEFVQNKLAGKTPHESNAIKQLEEDLTNEELLKPFLEKSPNAQHIIDELIEVLCKHR